MENLDIDNPQHKEFRSFGKVMDYLEEKLSPEETTAMEEAIEQDESLEDLVNEIHQAWMQNPNLRADATEAHAQLGEVFSNIEEQGQQGAKSIGLSPSWYWVAAAVVVMLILAWQFWPRSSNNLCDCDNVSQIVQETGVYSQHYTLRAAREPLPADQAFATYDNKNYQEAIPQFETLLDTNSQTTLENREMTLSLAVSYLMANRSADALPYLRRVGNFMEPRYQSEADWYTALVQIDLGNTPAARQHLQKLRDRRQLHADDAEKLLECIE